MHWPLLESRHGRERVISINNAYATFWSSWVQLPPTPSTEQGLPRRGCGSRGTGFKHQLVLSGLPNSKTVECLFRPPWEGLRWVPEPLSSRGQWIGTAAPSYPARAPGTVWILQAGLELDSPKGFWGSINNVAQ